MTDETTSPVITLDLEDTALVARLKAKLEEYTERLNNKNRYKAPEHYTGTEYRKRILEEVLRDGVVVTWDLSRKMDAEGTKLYADKFENACGVIQDYIETGGANNKGGKLPVV